MDEKMLFFKSFLEHPKQIGSVIPSSKFLIKELLKNVDFRNSTCIVEYGPGTGCITQEILKKARKDARVFCFEINRELCKYLQDNITDERLTIINDSAENIKKHLKRHNLSRVDYVISGMPFSTVPRATKYRIIQETKNSLNKNGKFVIYQFLNNFKKHLYGYFPKVSTKWIPLNIPPCFVYICER